MIQRKFLNLYKRRISTLIHPNPAKLPTISPEIYHKEALEKALSKNIAKGVKHVLVQPDTINPHPGNYYF